MSNASVDPSSGGLARTCSLNQGKKVELCSLVTSASVLRRPWSLSSWRWFLCAVLRKGLPCQDVVALLSLPCQSHCVDPSGRHAVPSDRWCDLLLRASHGAC